MDMMTTVSCASDLNTPADVLLVAFASMEGDMVDPRFGSASAFYLYGITAEKADLLTKQEFEHKKKDGNEDKLKPKLSWLADADIVYCGSVGGSATRQLIAPGVNPVQVKGGPDVEALVEALQHQLKGTPEFWLANILQQKRKTAADFRFDAMEEEGCDG